MSVASEITRINNNIANAYTQVSNKGGTLPATQNSNNLATAISSIPSGSSGFDYESGTYEPTTDTVRPTINFTKTHTKAPTYICIADVTTYGAIDFLGCIIWEYEDLKRDIIQGDIPNSLSSTTKSTVLTNIRFTRINTSTDAITLTSSMAALINPSSSTRDTSASYPRYHATESYFKPGYPNSASYTAPFLSGHTYKWKAYWID